MTASSRVRVAVAPRARVAAARMRLQDGAWSIGQSALGAGTAWTVARVVLGHPRPYFACVAVVVCIGVRAAQRLRRVGELAVGVTVGVAVGDALAREIGIGVWQISLVVAVALLLALTLDGGPLLVNQAGLQAVFVVALPRSPGSGLMRWEDALVGGLTALLIAFLLPADPWRAVHRAEARCLAELHEAAALTASSVRQADAAQADRALETARGTDAVLAAWRDALATSRDITRLSPLRRDTKGTQQAQERLQRGVDRAVRNLRVLARRVLLALETGERLPGAVADELDRFAAAVALLPAAEGPPAPLLALAAELDPDALGAHGVSAVVVVAQLRSAVVDLLVGLGLDPGRARTALPPL